MKRIVIRDRKKQTRYGNLKEIKRDVGKKGGIDWFRLSKGGFDSEVYTIIIHKISRKNIQDKQSVVGGG